MKQFIFLLLTVMTGCKTQQVSSTESTEQAKLEFHRGPEFDLFPMGKPQLLGKLTVTPVRPGLAVVTSGSKEITTKTTGSPSKFVHKDKSTVTINSGNVDKSKVSSDNIDKSKDLSKVASNNTDRTKNNSKGDVDRSRFKIKTPSYGWLIIIGLTILLLICVIWFFAPKIKKFLKPPGF